MRYSEHAAPRDAAHLIAGLWEFELDERDPPTLEHTIPPDGTTLLSLFVDASAQRGPLIVSGPRESAQRTTVEQGWRYFGVRLWPGAVRAVLGIDALALRNFAGPAFALPSERARALAATVDACSDAAAGAIADGVVRCADAGEIDQTMRAAVESLVANPALTVAALARAAHLGDRQFRRRFAAAVGLSPKAFARLRRLRLACEEVVNGERWRDAAHAAGFADQSHLGREVAAAFGWQPRLLAAYLERIDHGSLATPGGGARPIRSSSNAKRPVSSSR